MTRDSSPGIDAGRLLGLAGAVLLCTWILWSQVVAGPAGGWLQVRPGAHPVTDLLGWIPATDETRRSFAVWSGIPADPVPTTRATNRLALEPVPLALGQSEEWQRITGISATGVTGWASFANVTVLAGSFDLARISSSLDAAAYSRSASRGVAVWTAPEDVPQPRIVAGDDLRALAVIAVLDRWVVIGANQTAVETAIAAAADAIPSLADDPDIQRLVIPGTAGMMVADQRDMAVRCGVAGEWQTTDFAEASGRLVIVRYVRAAGELPLITSVHVQFGDEFDALAGLTELEQQWVTGFVNERGVGAEVADFGTTRAVYSDGAWVVAELTDGRDNGWVRSGVRFLVGICEQAATLVPGGDPPRATPVASPSP
ncbi:MAG: hypothetical protein M3Y37_08780, partial [Chloroflexota bacterium]|nr:hypothetical protein [Chloroflexota bacterium]